MLGISPTQFIGLLFHPRLIREYGHRRRKHRSNRMVGGDHISFWTNSGTAPRNEIDPNLQATASATDLSGLDVSMVGYRGLQAWLAWS